MTPYETYVDYLALKRHFTTPQYDYNKYNGKVNASHTAFETRGDKYSFVRLSKQKDAHEYLLANILMDPEIWIGDLVSPAGRDVYLKWKGKRERLGYIFKTDLKKLDDNFDSNFKVVNGHHPNILQLLLQEEIHIESFIILMELTNSIKYFNDKIDETFIWPMVRLKCQKYKSFFSYDKQRFKQIVVDFFTE